MKFIVTLFLVVTLSDLFHCSPSVSKGIRIVRGTTTDKPGHELVLDTGTESGKDDKTVATDRSITDPHGRSVNTQEPSTRNIANGAKAQNPEPVSPKLVAVPLLTYSRSGSVQRPAPYPREQPVQNNPLQQPVENNPRVQPLPYPTLQAVQYPHQQPMPYPYQLYQPQAYQEHIPYPDYVPVTYFPSQYEYFPFVEDPEHYSYPPYSVFVI